MHSTPAVAGELLFVASCNSMVRALDRASGRVVWEYDAGLGAESSFHGDPFLAGDLLLMGTDGPSGDGVYAFEKATGTLRWKARVPTMEFDISGVASDIQVQGQHVYALSLADEALSLRLSDGELTWSFRSAYRPHERILNGTPAIVAKTLLFGGLDGTAYALSGENGELRWKQRLGESILTSACAVEEGVVLGTTDGKLHLLDTERGSIVRQLNLGKTPSGPMIVADGRLLVCTDWLTPGSELMCVNDRLSEIVWKVTPPDGIWSAPRPYVYDGLLFLGTTEGAVIEYRLADGKPLRQTKIGGVIRGIRLVDGVLYVGTQDGVIYAVQR